jgi:hypothetical protein
MNASLKLPLVLCCCLFLSFVQEDNRITWTEERRLSWDDFKGNPVASNPAAALTYTDIKTSAQSDGNGVVTVMVNNYFDKQLSWTKNKISKELLAHEQLHFDITEVYTRLLREKLTSIATPEAIRSGKFNRESNKILTDWKQCQNKYDNETNHGTLAEKQKEWEEKIHSMLGMK